MFLNRPEEKLWERRILGAAMSGIFFVRTMKHDLHRRAFETSTWTKPTFAMDRTQSISNLIIKAAGIGRHGVVDPAEQPDGRKVIFYGDIRLKKQWLVSFWSACRRRAKLPAELAAVAFPEAAACELEDSGCSCSKRSATQWWLIKNWHPRD